MSDSMLIDEGDQDHTSHSMSSEEDQFQGDDSEIGVAELDEGEEEELESEEDDLPTLGTDAPELELGPIDDDENRMPLEEIPKIASGRPASRDFSKEKRTMEEGLERLLEIGKAQGTSPLSNSISASPKSATPPSVSMPFTICSRRMISKSPTIRSKSTIFRMSPISPAKRSTIRCACTSPKWVKSHC